MATVVRWNLNKFMPERCRDWCPIFWQGSDLIWIKEAGAENGSGMYRLVAGQEERLHENSGDFGHEYFPVLSADKKFLTYSACPNDQHSHLEANYQLFIKDLRSSEIFRITDDKFTNRWGQLVSVR